MFEEETLERSPRRLFPPKFAPSENGFKSPHREDFDLALSCKLSERDNGIELDDQPPFLKKLLGKNEFRILHTNLILYKGKVEDVSKILKDRGMI